MNSTDPNKMNVTLRVSDDAKKVLNEMNIKLNDQVIVANKRVINFIRKKTNI